MSDGGSIDRTASVLVVEDEPLVSDIVSEALAEQGFAVRVVDNAGAALACLSSDSPVDVLFTDLNLNGTMDGDALAQRARELRPDLAGGLYLRTAFGIRSPAAGRRLAVRAQALRSVQRRLIAVASGLRTLIAACGITLTEFGEAGRRGVL